MGDSRLKPGFGDKDNIEAAKENGDIDSFDVLFLTNGEIAWIDKDGETVMNTPRTQGEIVFSNGVTVEAGKTMDEMAEILGQFESSGGNPFVELGGKYADKLPTFAAGTYDQIAPAIEEGIIPYPSYVYVSDTKQLAFIDGDSNIQIIKGESQVLHVAELPDIEDGDEDVLYIYDGIVYVFTGTEYRPMYSDITSEVLSEVEKLESKVDALEEAVKNVMDASSGLVFDEYENFPTVGVANQLYIDINENVIYRYDDAAEAYTPLPDLEDLESPDLPITVLTGMADDVIIVGALEAGTYFVTGYYKIHDEDEVLTTSEYIPFLVSSNEEGSFVTEFNGGEITRYGAADTGDTEDYFATKDYVQEYVDEAVLGAMKERY